nr:nuclease-related domain-containing protein [Lysinibacillus timonensis]
MIVKPFSSYDITLGLNALKKRLSPSHEQFPNIVEELSRYEAGEQGEQYIMELLSENELPENTYIMHNVQFKSKVEVQIDVLVVTPYWCLLTEVKNIKGILYFNDNPLQLIRNEDGKEQILGSPETQLSHYCLGMKSFLDKNHLKVPIYGVIVFPYNNAIIKKPPKHFPVKVGRELIHFIWNSLPRNDVLVDPKNLVKLLKKERFEDDRFPLCKLYGVDKYEIRSGVECTECGTIPMIRTLRTWYCPKCKKNNMHAHKQALKDYAMLINKEITPREGVQFLHLRNRHEAKRFLSANSSVRMGLTKSSRYVLRLK